MNDTQLIEELMRMRKQPALPDAEYYCITMLGTEDGRAVTSTSSIWVGYTETKPRREVRKAIIVSPEFERQRFDGMEEPCVIVNDMKDMFIYQLMGGHGVIEKNLAQRFFPDFLGPVEIVQSYSKGYLSTVSLPPEKNSMHLLEKYECQ